MADHNAELDFPLPEEKNYYRAFVYDSSEAQQVADENRSQSLPQTATRPHLLPTFEYVLRRISVTTSSTTFGLPSPGVKTPSALDPEGSNSFGGAHSDADTPSASSGIPGTNLLEVTQTKTRSFWIHLGDRVFEESGFTFERGAALHLIHQLGYPHSRNPREAQAKYFIFDAIMASSEVDTKFLGQFARNIGEDHPLLARSLFQILGNLTMLSEYVTKARKLRRLDTTRDTPSVDLYCRIIWYAREGLAILEEFILPMVANYGELKVLSYKLRASYYHLYVLFHNSPPILLKKGTTVHTPPGLKSPRALKIDKGKGIDHGTSSPTPPNPDSSDPLLRPSSVQPTHPLEQGGPVGGYPLPIPPQPPLLTPSFLIPSQDFRPKALSCFQEASALSERLLWGSHPLRLSVKVEFCAFMYDCLHEREHSRVLAKKTIAEVYNAKEGMDDDMFEDAAQLVGIMGKMTKRGLGGASSGGVGSGSVGTAGSGGGPVGGGREVAVGGMDNPI